MEPTVEDVQEVASMTVPSASLTHIGGEWGICPLHNSVIIGKTLKKNGVSKTLGGRERVHECSHLKEAVRGF